MPTTLPRPAALVPLAVALLLPLTACSGGEESKTESKTPTEVLELAAQTLVDTEGVDLELSTEALPNGISGIVKASGVATHAPAFEGTLTVAISGVNAEVPVIAVDGTVYAKLPFTPTYDKVDPSEYGAPDPAELIAAEGGFPALLEGTEGVEKGDTVRGGTDNAEVFTTYAGTVPGSAMKAIIPSAAGDDFDVTWQISDDGELRSADFTGVFYADSDEMTYTVSFDDYGTEQEITAP